MKKSLFFSFMLIFASCLPASDLSDKMAKVKPGQGPKEMTEDDKEMMRMAASSHSAASLILAKKESEDFTPSSQAQDFGVFIFLNRQEEGSKSLLRKSFSPRTVSAGTPTLTSDEDRA